MNNKNIALSPDPSEAHTPTYDPNWLRSFKGCEHFSDQEAVTIIETLKNLSEILLNMSQLALNLIDNKQVIHLKVEKTRNKAA